MRPPAFDGAVAAFRYAFPIDRLVQALKFNARLALGGWLAAAMATRLPASPGVDLVVPLPLGRARLAQRGFNQSALLSRPLARDLRIAWRDDVLERVRETPPQSGLDRASRRRNVQGAFACRAGLDGARVALVDDVMTTGATLSAAAAALKAAGASGVVAWVVARAGRADWDNARDAPEAEE